jgi:ribosomal protein S18 acetylase RimI-like enzyme
VTVAELSAASLRARGRALVELIADAVDSNASVGYVWPLDDSRFAASWAGWIAEVEWGERIVLGALAGDELAGCVQLAPCSKPNQPHRADVQKLLVHRSFRRQGIARTLMRAAEARSLALGRTLLMLDTRSGSAADALYRDEGWTVLGEVPGFALDPDGRMAACTFFYKHLAA